MKKTLIITAAFLAASISAACAAVDTSATAFRSVAQSVEAMTQAKSQRQLADSHKTLVTQFEESASKAGATLNSLTGGLGVKAAGIGLGLGALVEGGKKAVTVFATVDEQARALAVSDQKPERAAESFFAALAEPTHLQG